MPRPCHCGRPDCGLCTLHRDSPRHRAAWDADPAPVPTPAAATPARGPCSHLGEPIAGAAASRLGLSVLRAWRPCARGHGTAGHVCQCGVGATCVGCPDWTRGGSE